MKIAEPKFNISDKKMKSLMHALNACRDLRYVQEPFGYGFDDLIDVTDSYIEKVNFLKDIIALADVARSKSFTSDTFDRELLSDIFTEIFIKAKGLHSGCCKQEVKDVTDEVNDDIRKFEDPEYLASFEKNFTSNFLKANEILNDKEKFKPEHREFLGARSIKSKRNNEIRLIEADVNEFVLRLGDIDYYVRLLGREFILNGIVSDSITFSEKVVKITDEK